MVTCNVSEELTDNLFSVTDIAIFIELYFGVPIHYVGSYVHLVHLFQHICICGNCMPKFVCIITQ